MLVQEAPGQTTRHSLRAFYCCATHLAVNLWKMHLLIPHICRR